MRVIVISSSLTLLGLLLPWVTCCSPGVKSPEKTSQWSTFRETPIPVPVTSVLTNIGPEEDTTRTSIVPIESDVEIDEKAMGTVFPLTEPLTITVVYDNNNFNQRLKTAWGFSALVEYYDHTLLFDTGGDGPTLIENMRVLGIEPRQIESVVLSHAHGDHTGGLNALLEFGAHPIVYLPPSFSASYKNQVRKTTKVIEVTPGLPIAEGIYTTGEMGRSISEQALIIQTDRGLVIITGCAHPGIVEIVEQARQMFDERVLLVLGGFHLGSKSQAEIDAILKDFRRLEVEQVAPCHCTGERAIAMFAAEYGEDFIQAGVGRVFRLDAIVTK